MTRWPSDPRSSVILSAGCRETSVRALQTHGTFGVEVTELEPDAFDPLDGPLSGRATAELEQEVESFGCW